MFTATPQAAVGAPSVELEPEHLRPPKPFTLLIPLPAPTDPDTLAAYRFPEDEPVEVEARAVAGGWRVTIPEGCVGGARWWLESAEQLSPIHHLPPFGASCEDGDPVPTTLGAKARLNGGVTAPRGYGLPSHGRLQLEACQGAPPNRRQPLLDFPVKVQRNGTFTASLPTGCWQPILRLGEFAPVKLPRTELQPGTEETLPTIALKPGAALLVRVADADSGRDLPGARVEIIRPGELDAAVAESYVHMQPLNIVGDWSGRRGWVRLFGLEPGRAHLRASALDYATIFTATLELQRGLETQYDELELPRPAALTVEVVGGSSAAAGSPDGAPEATLPLAVNLLPELSCGTVTTTLAETLPTSRGGVARWQELAPGTWRVSVVRSSDSGWGQTLLDRTVELASGESRQLRLDLERLRFFGRVSRDGEPVAGRLEIEPVHGGQTTATTLGSEGEFSVPLANPGLHRVEVWQGTDKVTALEAVPFDDPEEVVHIELPLSGIQGRVLDPQLNPVAGVSLLALQIRSAFADPLRKTVSRVWARSDSEGYYRFETLPAGTWLLKAETSDLVAEPVAVPLEEDSREEVDFQLTHRSRLSGRVVDPRGEPLAGARGWAWLEEGPYGFLSSRIYTFETEASGHFSLPVGWKSGLAGTITVTHPAHAVDVHPVRTGRFQEISLSRMTASVELVFGPGAEVIDSWVWLVNEEGVRTTLRTLARAGAVRGLEGNRVHYRIPNLAPGTWRVLHFSTMESSWAGATDDRSTAETRFTALPGMITRVAVASPASAPEPEP